MRNSRRGDVDPFIVMDVMEQARAAEAAGRHIIHMEVGQPGTGAPRLATDALARAMDQGPLGYTVALGCLHGRLTGSSGGYGCVRVSCAFIYTTGRHHRKEKVRVHLF